MEKKCKQCNKKFSKAYNTSKRVFSIQKFCGKECYGKHISGKNRPISEETKIKIGLANKNNRTGLKNGKRTRFKKGQVGRFLGVKRPDLSGPNHYAWKGGVTKENEKIRKSIEYKAWRKSVFERDNYTCVWCGVHGGLLNADHIKPFAYFPELRFDISNGRTLCVPCHMKTDTFMYKSAPQVLAKTNSY